MKYIDSEKLIAEIERRLVKYDSYYTSAGSELKGLLYFIASLQQEQPEVDLENKLDEWMKYGPHTCYPWCSITDAIEITARHFYELGLNARKEE